MARPFAEHLNDEEVAFLALQAPDVIEQFAHGESSSLDPPFAEAALHARTCSQCQSQLRVQREMDRVFKGFQVAGRIGIVSKCPGLAVWNDVAAGLLSGDESLSLLRHASECPRCAAELKQSIEILTPAATPKEESLLASLPSATPDWRAQTALRLRDAAALQPRGHARWWSLAPRTALVTAASLSIAIAASVAWFWIRPAHSADTLIAQAYTQNRVTDLRFRGAACAPVRATRGAQPSGVGKPLPLLEAEVIVARNLAKNPDDPNFLDARVKTDILDGNSEDAVRSVTPPKTIQPATAALATDLATAYFMHSEASGDKEDLAEANDLLDAVLQISPNDTAALFNSAIVKEKLDLKSLALDAWDKYLQLETNPAWKQEGQTRADALRRALDLRDRSVAVPVPDPAAALPILVARATGPPAPAALDESWMQIALTQWLPALGSDPPANSQPDSASRALAALAVVLRAGHHDDWLADLLSSPHSPAWRQGVNELSLAASADSNGDLLALIEHGRASLAAFHRDRNPAGETAAQLEYATGITRSQQGDHCLPVALSAARQVHAFRYPWVETNLLFQLSTCYGIRGDPHLATTAARLAAAIAQQSSYDNLRLESLYYLDGVTAPWVASSAAWGNILSGLDRFWSVRHLPEYGAIFYCDMAFDAESQARYHTAEDAAREAVLFFAETGNRTNEAGARHYLAEAAEAANDPQLAEAEYRRAAAMFSRPTTEDAVAKATLEIQRATLELRQNRIASASARLAQVNAILPSIGNDFARLPWFEALGELHLRSGQPALAEQDLLNAVRLVESSGPSLASDDDVLLWHRYNSAAYRTLLEIYSRVQHDNLKSFEFQEWYRGAPLRESVHHTVASQPSPDIPPDLAAYAPARLPIPHNTAVLSWIAFPSGLALWLDDDQGPTLVWQNVTLDQLNATVQRFSARCADPSSDPRGLHADARQLYSWLIQPFSSRLTRTTTLIVESDPSLAAIPFPALENSSGQVLADQFTLVESPGIDYTRRLHREAALSAASPALSIGNPRLTPEMSAVFPPLPDAEAEAASIADDFHRRFLLTGDAATLPRVEALLPRAAILHYAGHALLRQHDPGLLLTGIPPSDPAVLDADRFRALDLDNLQLAVLSACGTASTDQGLAGPGNLVRAFLSAGVPHVVASRWRVDSRVTSALMTDFYARLLRGDSPPQALRAAEARIRAHPETSHPYYWAAFSSFGS